MKILRIKRVRKHLRVYQMAYGLEAPYTMLMDADFILAALDGKIHLKEQLPKLMQATCYPCVTSCMMEEVRRHSSRYPGVGLTARHFQKLKCCHADGPLSTEKCLMQYAKGNEAIPLDSARFGMCIGVQSPNLRKKLREHAVAGRVPLIYVQGQVPVVEAPSCIAIEAAKKKDAAAVPKWEKKLLGIEEAPANAIVVKKRKQPNPLSCLKEKKKLKSSKTAVQAKLPVEGPAKLKRTRSKRRKTESCETT